MNFTLPFLNFLYACPFFVHRISPTRILRFAISSSVVHGTDQKSITSTLMILTALHFPLPATLRYRNKSAFAVSAMYPVKVDDIYRPFRCTSPLRRLPLCRRLSAFRESAIVTTARLTLRQFPPSLNSDQ